MECICLDSEVSTCSVDHPGASTDHSAGCIDIEISNCVVSD